MRLTISTLLSVGTLACGGAGAPDKPATLTINSYRIGGPANTQLVAVQDGDGPWTALTGTAGIYTATIHGDRYGVMTSCATTTFGGGPTIYYATIADGTTLYFDDCEDPGEAMADITGTITGAAAADPVRVHDSFFQETDVPAGTTTYMLTTLAGSQTLIAEELVDKRPVKLARMDATVHDGAKVNFDLAAGFAPVTHALSVSGTISGASLSYRDVNGITRLDTATAPFDTFRAIPADKLGNGLNRLSAGDTAGSEVIRYFKDPVDQHVTFPAALQLAQQPTATATPYPNVQFTVPVRADAMYDLDFSTTNTTTGLTRMWSIEMTSAWVGEAFPGATSFSYTAPDFHDLPGWRTEFQAEAKLTLDWTVLATKNVDVEWFPTVPPGVFFDHDGSELQFTSVDGQLAAP